MQTDGRVLHDADADEIGLKLFEAPLYAPYLNLLTLGRRIAAEPEGTGTYEFLATGTHKEATREAAWVTAGLHGTEWRLVLTREVTPAR
jgi:polar amino acid transport system substrate-binding protein